MDNTVTERIKLIIKNEQVSLRKFSELTHIPESTLKNMFVRHTNPSYDILSKVSNAYKQYSLNWLINGDGEMLSKQAWTKKTEILEKKEKENSTYITDEPKKQFDNYLLVPQYSLDVVGGSYNKEVDTMGFVTGYVPFVNAKKNDICCPVTGNSMYPTYPSGCIVLVRQIDYWQKFLEFGQVYIIELFDDRRLIKEVRRGKDEEHFLLVSHNKNFDEIQVPLEMIRAVWIVLAKYEKAVM